MTRASCVVSSRHGTARARRTLESGWRTSKGNSDSARLIGALPRGWDARAATRGGGIETRSNKLPVFRPVFDSFVGHFKMHGVVESNSRKPAFLVEKRDHYGDKF